MHRSFSSRGKPGDVAGEGFSPGTPGYAGRTIIRLPEGFYTGDPGSFWKKPVRGRFGEEISSVRPGEEVGEVENNIFTGSPRAEFGKEAGGVESSEERVTEGISRASTSFGTQAQKNGFSSEPVGGQSESDLNAEIETGSKTEPQA